MPDMPRVSLDLPAIEVTDLRKRYGQVDALAGLTMTVGRGEVFGFLGPNGAGKTTTVKLLLGLARPTGGSGKVLGAPLGDLATRRKIGYLPELFRYQPWMQAREVLTLHGELTGIPRARRRAAADEALGIVGLSDRAGDIVGKFSKGMQQRLGLGAALIGEPALIVLDEPTSALDPVGRVDVRGIVKAAAARGAAVFLNSHLLSEVEQVCDRVAIIDHGRVVASGDLDDVLGQAETQVRVGGVSPTDLAAFERFGTPILDGDKLTIRPMDAELVPDLVATLVGMGAKVYEVHAGRSSLERRFLDLVARDRPPAGTPSATRLR
jgi:ABC-2 type transport system ATP-binding protein